MRGNLLSHWQAKERITLPRVFSWAKQNIGNTSKYQRLVKNDIMKFFSFSIFRYKIVSSTIRLIIAC